PVLKLSGLARALLVLDGAQLRDPARRRVLEPGGRLAQRVERRADASVELGRDRPRMVTLGLRPVDHHDLGLLAEGGAEAEAEVHRDADDDRDVGSLETGAARA